MGGGEAFRVGGWVRDTLLGLPVGDADWVVVGLSAPEMLARGFMRVGNDFSVFLHPVSKEEYALARGGEEGKVTLAEDLFRRDLTINAMAINEAGDLIDPYHGQEDLQRRILRHVSPAFADDPLRVLRVARFAARFADFSIAPETLDLMTRLSRAGALDQITAERVWLETEKALSAAEPARYFEVLRQVEALPRLFPELSALVGVPQSPRHHPEGDAWTHTLLTLSATAAMSPASDVRFAALAHDLGKGNGNPQEWPSHHAHEKRGIALVQALCTCLKAPNAHLELATLATRWHMHVHRAFEIRAKKVVRLFTACDGFRRPERFTQLLMVCQADHGGGRGFDNVAYPQAAFLQESLAACQTIDNQSLLEQGYRGPAFAQALYLLRIAKVKGVRAMWKQRGDM